MSFDLPILPGYSVRTGKETVFGLGYQCEESLLLHSCLLKGLAEVRRAGGRRRGGEGWGEGAQGRKCAAASNKEHRAVP